MLKKDLSVILHRIGPIHKLVRNPSWTVLLRLIVVSIIATTLQLCTETLAHDLLAPLFSLLTLKPFSNIIQQFRIHFAAVLM